MRGAFVRAFLPAGIDGQDAGAAFDPLADFDAQHRLGGQHDVDARAEFDEADALAALHGVALPRMEDDAAGQQAGDLLEGDLHAAVGPWPRTVTTFCSLRSAEAGFMALRYLPFW